MRATDRHASSLFRKDGLCHSFFLLSSPLPFPNLLSMLVPCLASTFFLFDPPFSLPPAKWPSSFKFRDLAGAGGGGETGGVSKGRAKAAGILCIWNTNSVTKGNSFVQGQWCLREHGGFERESLDLKSSIAFYYLWDVGLVTNFSGTCSLLFLFIFLFLWLFRAAPEAQQARDRIRAAAASLHHSHSHARFELPLCPTPPFMAMSDT